MPPEEGPGYEEEEVVNKEVDKEEVDIEKRRGSEEEMLERRHSQVCPKVFKSCFVRIFAHSSICFLQFPILNSKSLDHTLELDVGVLAPVFPFVTTLVDNIKCFICNFIQQCISQHLVNSYKLLNI